MQPIQAGRSTYATLSHSDCATYCARTHSCSPVRSPDTGLSHEQNKQGDPSVLRQNVIDRHGALNISETNVYHALNPVGAYGLAVMRPTFTAMFQRSGIGLQGKRILDLGCGMGSWTRFMAELKADPQ